MSAARTAATGSSSQSCGQFLSALCVSPSASKCASVVSAETPDFTRSALLAKAGGTQLGCMVGLAMNATGQCSGRDPCEKAHSTLQRIVSARPPGTPNAAGTKGTPASVSQKATEYRDDACVARCDASANPADNTCARAAS